MKTVNLNKFKDFTGTINYAGLIKRYGRKAVSTLESVSPKSNRIGRKTPYSKGWTVFNYKMRQGEKAIVWNRTNWQLTHLLENGHLVTNNKNTKYGLAWVAPRPHIQPTYRELKPKFIKDAQKVEIDFELK